MLLLLALFLDAAETDATSTAEATTATAAKSQEAEPERDRSQANAEQQGDETGPIEGPFKHPFEQGERVILARTNAFRRGHGLGQLTRNDNLDAVAQWFADYMGRTGHYGHEGDGREPHERIQAGGYAYCRVGENIGWQERERSDGSEVAIEPIELGRRFFEGWRASPPHRENLLTAEFTEIGLGLAHGDDGRYYGVQLFGRPKSLQFAVELMNRSGQDVQYTLGQETFTLKDRYWRQHTLCRSLPLVVADDYETELTTDVRLVITNDDETPGTVAVVDDGSPQHGQAAASDEDTSPSS